MQNRISDETELIQTYLLPLAAPGSFALNDDAALISVKTGFDLVVSTDPIREGVHFFSNDDPRDIGWKALAVNVSDLIAKGATPVGYTMAFALPEAPLKSWMAAFSTGLGEAQQAFGCKLLGGDCDRADGPLSIAVTAFGQIPSGQFIQRSTARIGDHVFVTGTIGDATLGLKVRQNLNAFGDVLAPDQANALLKRYLRPQPNMKAIDIVRRFASAALDVSDGLIQDAARLAGGANAALSIPATAIPLSAAASEAVRCLPQIMRSIVSGGDDYQVLFAVGADDVANMLTAANAVGLLVQLLGTLEPGHGVTLLDASGTSIPLESAGYDHFRDT